MEGKKTKPRALLIFGAPCSGKTTFSMKFAEKFDLAYYDMDDIKKKYKFSDEEIISVFELITKTRQTLIIDGGINTEKERNNLKNMFIKAGYNPFLIWIQTDINTIKLRMKSRHKSISKAKIVYDDLIKDIEAPAQHEKPIILSGKHTFETQTKHVLAGLANDRKR